MDRFSFGDVRILDVRGKDIDGKELSEQQVRRRIFDVLDSSVLCSMATVTPDGVAHINNANFSYSDKLELYFLSHPESLHCRNLLNNDTMAMTISSTQQRWNDPGLGVQLFGTCEMTSESCAGQAERSYQKRFEGYGEWKITLKDDDLAHQYRFYRFNVAEIKILDEKNQGDAVFVRASILRH